jgi:hypothetical protein
VGSNTIFEKKFVGSNTIFEQKFLEILSEFFYLPTDAQESCFKNINIYIKTAPTCFGLITITRERII